MVLSGQSPDGRLVEIVELRDHPWFVASQFHPEFKSRPDRPASAVRRVHRERARRRRRARAGPPGPRVRCPGPGAVDAGDDHGRADPGRSGAIGAVTAPAPTTAARAAAPRPAGRTGRDRHRDRRRPRDRGLGLRSAVLSLERPPAGQRRRCLGRRRVRLGSPGRRAGRGPRPRADLAPGRRRRLRAADRHARLRRRLGRRGPCVARLGRRGLCHRPGLRRRGRDVARGERPAAGDRRRPAGGCARRRGGRVRWPAARVGGDLVAIDPEPCCWRPRSPSDWRCRGSCCAPLSGATDTSRWRSWRSVAARRPWPGLRPHPERRRPLLSPARRPPDARPVAGLESGSESNRTRGAR